MQARGESRSRRFDRDEALRRRHADVEAPTPYPGWEDTITVGMPRSKKHFTMRLDVFDWLRTQGKGYQTRINAVLRAYMKAQKRDPG